VFDIIFGIIIGIITQTNTLTPDSPDSPDPGPGAGISPVGS
jgi:hypothetical protein